MLIEFTQQKITYSADLSQPIDISLPIGQVSCFYAPKFDMKPYRSGNFVGAVKAGAPVNFFNVFFNPHGNGTHTECIGHITEDQQSINQTLKQYHFMARLVSVELVAQANGDQVITLDTLREQLSDPLPEAVIIRTLPNNPDKQYKNYSGSNPPYLAGDAMAYLVAKGVKHLLIDLPSVDREDDGGQLTAHKLFWQAEAEARMDCSITELIYVPDRVGDGLYLLNLQIAPFELDASPAKPIIYLLQQIY